MAGVTTATLWNQLVKKTQTVGVKVDTYIK